MNNNLSLRSVLETNKLAGPNFLDWHRNLRLVLRQEKIEYVLDRQIPQTPEPDSPEAATFNVGDQEKHKGDAIQAQCVMLLGMTPELQK